MKFFYEFFFLEISNPGQAPGFTMSMTEARTKLGASDNLFKKVYQGLKARDVIEYIKNDLNIHKKIITVRDPRTPTITRPDKKSTR